MAEEGVSGQEVFWQVREEVTGLQELDSLLGQYVASRLGKVL